MKKIFFNDQYGLTKAVLEGRKTVLRREININSLLDFVADDIRRFFDGGAGGFQELVDKHAKYKVGEIVAIAQSYSDCELKPINITYDGNKYNRDWLVKSAGWHNKMFVKANLMPNHIRITNIRVERLHDISDADCMREGISKFHPTSPIFGWNFNIYFDTPREAFAELIDKVLGKGTWERNPYVFVYEFELI